MGFSLIAASCVIGISLLIVFETFSGTIAPLVSDVHTAYEDMMNQKIEKAQTNLAIMNVSTNTNGTDSYDLTIIVKNNGDTTISMSDCNLLLNGILRSFHTSNTLLFPQEESQFQINNITEVGVVRLKLVTSNDIETYYEFNVWGDRIGFSLTGAHIIFFIASVIVAGAVSGVFIVITNDLAGSFSEKGHRIQEEIETEFAIINDPAAIPLENNSYVFYIKNIGNRKIVTTNSTFQLFIDGDIVSSTYYFFNTETVYSGEYSSMFVNQTIIGSGYHTLRIIGPLTIEDTFQFKIL